MGGMGRMSINETNETNEIVVVNGKKVEVPYIDPFIKMKEQSLAMSKFEKLFINNKFISIDRFVEELVRVTSDTIKQYEKKDKYCYRNEKLKYTLCINYDPAPFDPSKYSERDGFNKFEIVFEIYVPRTDKSAPLKPIYTITVELQGVGWNMTIIKVTDSNDEIVFPYSRTGGMSSKRRKTKHNRKHKYSRSTKRNRKHKYNRSRN
jgi:hypothetical protein